MVGSLINLVVYILVIGLIVWLLHYLIDAIPLPEPFNRVAKVVLLVVSVLIIIVLLLQFAGIADGGLPKFR